MEAGSATRPLASAWARQAVSVLRIAAPAAYLLTLTVFVWRDGVPAQRDRLLVWIVLGLLAVSVSNLRGWARGVVVDWLPLALVLWAYDLLRGQADGLFFSAYFRPQLEADAFLLGGTAPTVWLQEHLWHGSWDLRWYDYGAWGVYMSYFLAVYLLAGVLWFAARHRFRAYVATVSLLAGMGFATYALFPAAPPWLASREGELEWTTRTIRLVSNEVPVFDFGALFERGAEYANPVAAVPSLHAAYTLLVALYVWRAARWARPLAAAYPPAMAFALVYTAEHYLVDVLLGFLYTAIAVWAVARIGRAGWRLPRRGVASAASPPSTS